MDPISFFKARIANKTKGLELVSIGAPIRISPWPIPDILSKAATLTTSRPKYG